MFLKFVDSNSGEWVLVVRPHKIFLGNLCVFKCESKKVLKLYAFSRLDVNFFGLLVRGSFAVLAFRQNMIKASV